MIISLKKTTARLVFLLGIASNLSAQEAAELQARAPRVTTLSVDVSRVSFLEDIDPWSFASASLGHRTSRGSLIGRVNYANRFGGNGTQFEADAYPRLWDGAYAYLSGGYSGSSIFPKWRSGAELFLSLPSAYEASFGYRQLRFSGTPTTLITGAVGRYVGNDWFSLRPYIHASSTGTSASLGLTARRFFADADHYIGGRVSYGSSPPEEVTADALSIARLRSFSANLGGSGDIGNSLLGTWSLGFEREELTATRNRRNWSAGLGMRVRL